MITDSNGNFNTRYARQTAFAPFGKNGQKHFSRSRALIIGVGGLGSWVAELLARAGIGSLCLVDSDCVELTNIHRQAFYTEDDAKIAAARKVAVAREKIAHINSSVNVDIVFARADASNIGQFAENCQLVIDGTDNFPTRFVINDFAIKNELPWIFAGVLGATAQTMTILPHRKPCLRCVFPDIPEICAGQTCREIGVLGPAVSAISSFVAFEALKVLSGNFAAASTYLTSFDLWNNRLIQIDTKNTWSHVHCECCDEHNFEFLDF